MRSIVRSISVFCVPVTLALLFLSVYCLENSGGGWLPDYGMLILSYAAMISAAVALFVGSVASVLGTQGTRATFIPGLLAMAAIPVSMTLGVASPEDIIPMTICIGCGTIALLAQAVVTAVSR